MPQSGLTCTFKAARLPKKGVRHAAYISLGEKRGPRGRNIHITLMGSALKIGMEATLGFPPQLPARSHASLNKPQQHARCSLSLFQEKSCCSLPKLQKLPFPANGLQVAFPVDTLTSYIPCQNPMTIMSAIYISLPKSLVLWKVHLPANGLQVAFPRGHPDITNPQPKPYDRSIPPKTPDLSFPAITRQDSKTLFHASTLDGGPSFA